MSTTDGGATWSGSSETLPYPPADLQFVDAQHGWAARATAPSCARPTAARPGMRPTSPPGRLPARFSFIDDLDGFCETNKPLQDDRRRPDTGRRTLGQSNGAAGLQFIDAQHGWILSGLSVFRSTDGGASWTHASDISPPDGAVLHMADTLHGWIVGPMRG